MRRATIATVLLALTGCGSDVPHAGTDLVLDTESLTVGGVNGFTIDSAGAQYILAGSSLLERVDGTWSEVWTAPPGTESLEDVVALGEGRFALTTRNMGYELDLASNTLTEHFCYEPGDFIRQDPVPEQPKPTVEISRSVAYDVETNLILANPQTVTDDVLQDPIFSEIASFDRASGDELTFRNLRDPGFSAGGLVVLDFPTLIAGEGAMLVAIDFEEGRKRDFLDLGGLDVSSVEGLALDRENDALHVLDGPTQRLITLRLSQVELAL